MTREELAEKSGVSRSMISMLEKGTRKHPTLVTVHALATALDVSVEELVAGPVPKRGKKRAKARHSGQSREQPGKQPGKAKHRNPDRPKGRHLPKAD